MSLHARLLAATAILILAAEAALLSPAHAANIPPSHGERMPALTLQQPTAFSEVVDPSSTAPLAPWHQSAAEPNSTLQQPASAPPAQSQTLWVSGWLLATGYVPFRSHPVTLEQPLNATHAQNLTAAIQGRAPSGVDLSTFFTHPETMVPVTHARAEIISPSEFAILSAVGITMNDVDDIAHNNYIVYAIFTVDCVGRYATTTADGGLVEVAYLRARGINWSNMRVAIESLYLSRGGTAGLFRAADYQAHVVIATTRGAGDGSQEPDSGVSAFVDANVGRQGQCLEAVMVRVGGLFD